VAWFIGQSAVMIVLAFLLGLFVGWLIWGRRVRTLLIEIRDLRTRVAELEADSGGAKLPAAAGERPIAVEEHEEPVHEDESVIVPAVVNSAGSVGTNGASAAVDTLAASSGNGAATSSKSASKRASRAGSSKTASPEPAPATEEPAAAGAPVHIPAPRGEMTGSTVAADEDVVSSAGSIGVTEPDAGVDADADTAGAGRAHAGASADAGDADAGEAGGVAEDVVSSAGSVGIAPAGAEPHETGPIDDLARIEGIGPKIAAALVAAGIRTYAQLADADEISLTKAINAAGIHFAPSMPTWAQQARLLADGDEAAFIALTDRLIAGREVAAATAASSVPDDFARIEGIGPKIAAALVAAGIRTFAQLAAADEDTLTTAINTAGIHFAPSIGTWSEQARLLADGDEERFAELTARLIAGRRPDDDLERIEGIGPKMAAALHTAGIRTYRGLADSDDAKLRAAITAAGLSFAPSVVTWSRQARLLADGDEDGFADLTRRLVAGRDEGRA
jgi:predicted flap endonuclease-1-like 5' DNA nuclease